MENIYYATLGFLLNNNKHGYELYKEISEDGGIDDIYTIKIGRLYAILKKLEDSEFLISSIDPDGNRPARKVYTITDSGRQTFNRWMQDPIKRGREIRIGFLLKLYFLRNISQFDPDEVIQTQITECQRWLEIQLNKLRKNEDVDSFEYYIPQFRKSQIEGYITWLNWCKRSFKDD